MFSAVRDILAMGGSGCVGLGYSMRLSTAVFLSFPFSSDDNLFLSVPFRLKFLWLGLLVPATAKCPSTWLNCDKKEEAENEI